MAVDHDNLQESASVEVTAVILLLVSFMTVSMIISYQRNLKYHSAQNMLISIFLMPVLIGWSAWTELILERQARSLEFLMNLFKAICIASFMVYLEKMLGWVKEGEENTYSEEKKLRLLSSGPAPNGLCGKMDPIKTPEEAKKFLRKIRIAVFQLCAVLILLGIAGICMILATDNLDFTDPTQNTIFSVFSGIKSISSVVCLVALLRLILYVRKIPEMEHFEFMHKFIIIKLGILFTEVQPLVIKTCAYYDLIANNEKYTVEAITSYTNNLMIVSEMIIISFLLLIVFPLSDYEIHPELRQALAQERQQV